MNLDLPFKPEKLYYGVPYGTQLYGTPLEGEKAAKGDEIKNDLYDRYREVEKWFAAESGGFGICIASNLGAYDFDGQKIWSTMMRNVRSIGDQGFDFVNKGIFRYHYVITSYSGKWEGGTYYKGWELAQPLAAVPVAKNGEGTLPAEHSFVSTGDKGILTVFKKADNSNGYMARIFNTTPREEGLEWGNNLGLTMREVVAMRELAIDDPADRLAPYEIKTVRLN